MWQPGCHCETQWGGRLDTEGTPCTALRGPSLAHGGQRRDHRVLAVLQGQDGCWETDKCDSLLPLSPAPDLTVDRGHHHCPLQGHDPGPAKLCHQRPILLHRPESPPRLAAGATPLPPHPFLYSWEAAPIHPPESTAGGLTSSNKVAHHTPHIPTALHPTPARLAPQGKTAACTSWTPMPSTAVTQGGPPEMLPSSPHWLSAARGLQGHCPAPATCQEGQELTSGLTRGLPIRTFKTR